MLMTRERRPAIRTLRGWAISVLHEAGAIRECEEHAMRNSVSIDAMLSRAIAAEIGERLRSLMRAEREIPPSLKSLLDRLRTSEKRATSG